MATNRADYNFKEIEKTWQDYWKQNQTFRAKDFDSKPKYYVLDMFPYPSGAGLHIGHPEGYTASDIVARYRRAKGFNVLHPMGWDAFGLPTEQYAIQTGTHPAETNRRNIANFRGQIERLGFAYDWSREIDTTDPRYYRWTQWIFRQLFNRGLAYVDERPVWWCPELRTVLANEEVINGHSERGNHPVERRNLRQWVLKITAYADRLLEDLKNLDWPDSTKRQQEAWIGRSEGAEVDFDLPDGNCLSVFTTRPDTLFGATYMVIAPEHPLVDALTTAEQRKNVEKYRLSAAAKSDLERTDLAKEKTGVFTGGYATNPVNEERIPVWIADYVLMSYGTGAIMAVPAHDERDWQFARKFGLEIREVVSPPEGAGSKQDACFAGEGINVNSAFLDGLPTPESKKRIISWLGERGRGKAAVQYKLRDWLFSRQRFWGEPFPIVWVEERDYEKVGMDLKPPFPVGHEKDGRRYLAVCLPEKSLPLKLPEIETFQPSGTGESPLAGITDWVDIWFNWQTGETVPASQTRPEGGTWIRGRRETNTMPQWAGSCWYHLRYLDPHNEQQPVAPELAAYWGVPDLYIGGAEHAVLHLLYARFWHKFLFDTGVAPGDEPFRKLFHQGIILGEDGNKMSKSLGNVVNPDTVISEFGADSLRLYEMFLGPLEAMKPWNARGIEGVFRFLKKTWRVFIGRDGEPAQNMAGGEEPDPDTGRLLAETIRKVEDDILGLRFNTAISQMMIFINHLQKTESFAKETALSFVRILAPFAPHLAEELWARLGGRPSVSDAPWPAVDTSRLEKKQLKIIFQVNGKTRGDAMVPTEAKQEDVLALAQEHEKVKPLLAGKTIRKVVFVPGRILNLVVS